MSPTPAGAAPVPILLYHRVGPEPSSWIAPFNVTTETLDRHLALVEESGRTPVTVSRLCDAMAGRVPLPERPVVISFDDGFVDTLTLAAPLLARYGHVATVYITSGFLAARSPGGDLMLDWAQARELAAQGHEIGAHSVTHPQLDLLAAPLARSEIQVSKAQLEEGLERRIRSFAYPHGYSSPLVRRSVVEAGFDSACSVKNALCSPRDPLFSLARLTVAADTPVSTVRRWLGGEGAPVGLRDDRAAARAWRAWRRARAMAPSPVRPS